MNRIEQERIAPLRSLIVASAEILDYIRKQTPLSQIHTLGKRLPPEVYIDFNGGLGMHALHDTELSLKILERLNHSLESSIDFLGSTWFYEPNSRVYKTNGKVNFSDAITLKSVYCVQIGLCFVDNTPLVKVNRFLDCSWQYALFHMFK